MMAQPPPSPTSLHSWAGQGCMQLSLHTMSAAGRAIEPHGGHGLGIPSPWQAGADCSSLAPVPGQVHVPFSKLEAQLDLCALESCRNWPCRTPPSSCLLEEWGSVSPPCLPEEPGTEEEPALKTCLGFSQLPWRRT